jgi:nitrite reductase (NADH) small subunit
MTAGAPKTRKHRVGSVADFPPRTMKVVRVGTRSIGIANAGGALYAILNVCPHELSPICEHGTITGTTLPSSVGEVEYGLEDRVLRCPWHGYEFDLQTGRALFTKFRGKLRMFPVSVERGDVLVEIRESEDERRGR